MNKIEVAGLYFSYGRRLVLQGVDFSLRPGVTGLLGQNGSGKTTLLRLLAGDLRPSAGKISLREVSLLKLLVFFRNVSMC